MANASNFENSPLNNSSERENNGSPEQTGNKKSRRGFAAMDPARQREIARQGGQVAHKLGVAHQWNSDEAREAGRKGGQNSRGGGRLRNNSPE